MLVLWLGALSAQEKELVNKLFKDTNVRLYNISLKITRSPADAEDAVAQSFLHIIEHIEKISALPCPQRLPYCVIIVKNVCVDLLRKRNAVPLVLGEDADDFADGDDYIGEAVQSADLATAMAKLPPADRRLLQLRYARDMSYREIAVVLGTSEETAKKRGQRAIDRLRQVYAEGDCHADSK